MAATDMWTYPDAITTDIVGYSVQATDGGIGKVDEASNEVGASYIVVDTGPWIFGKRVMLPAGVVDRVDHDDETIFVSRTKDEIKNAPEFDPAWSEQESYRDELGSYYGGVGTPTGGAALTTPTAREDFGNVRDRPDKF